MSIPTEYNESLGKFTGTRADKILKTLKNTNELLADVDYIPPDQWRILLRDLQYVKEFTKIKLRNGKVHNNIVRRRRLSRLGLDGAVINKLKTALDLQRVLAHGLATSYNLQSMEFNGIPLGQIGLRPMVDGFRDQYYRFEKLRVVAFKDSRMGSKGLLAVKTFLSSLPFIQRIDLSGCALDDSAVPTLIHIFKAHSDQQTAGEWQYSLRNLDEDEFVSGMGFVNLEDNQLSNAGVTHLARYIGKDRWIRALHLDKNKFGEVGAEHLKQALGDGGENSDSPSPGNPTLVRMRLPEDGSIPTDILVHIEKRLRDNMRKLGDVLSNYVDQNDYGQGDEEDEPLARPPASPVPVRGRKGPRKFVSKHNITVESDDISTISKVRSEGEASLQESEDAYFIPDEPEGEQERHEDRPAPLSRRAASCDDVKALGQDDEQDEAGSAISMDEANLLGDVERVVAQDLSLEPEELENPEVATESVKQLWEAIRELKKSLHEETMLRVKYQSEAMDLRAENKKLKQKLAGDEDDEEFDVSDGELLETMPERPRVPGQKKPSPIRQSRRKKYKGGQTDPSTRYTSADFVGAGGALMIAGEGETDADLLEHLETQYRALTEYVERMEEALVPVQVNVRASSLMGRN